MSLALDAQSASNTSTLATYRALLIKYLGPQWLRTLFMTLLLFISIALQLVNPQILRYFIDAATNGADTTSLTLSGFLFVGVSLINQVASILAVYVSENVAWTATNALRTDLVAHGLKLDMAFHKAHTSGEMIERIDGDVNALANFFSQSVIYLLGNTLLILGIVILLFAADWRIGIVMAIFVVIAFTVLYRLREFAIPAWERNRAKNAEFFGFLSEQLAGTADIRANGATGYVMQRFYALLRAWYPINRRAGLSGYAMGMATVGIFGVGNALAFAVGAYLWSTHAITLGTAYIVFYYTSLLEDPLQQIRMQLQQLQQAGAGIERVQQLLRTTPTLEDTDKTLLPSGALSVDFDSVSFGYNARNAEDRDNMILHDISFHLQQGRVLGVLGRTGSGKTTLARLLLRLYDIQSGQIRLGGVPIQETGLRDLRQHIGMVTQDVQLFNASVRDNLTFFNPHIPDERIISVLDDLGLAHWLHSLPQGLDTELGSDSEGLSAGEAQLLAFTRVFLSNPGLVILDEASSRLDPATEQLIERAIHKLFTGRTAIVIAHRLATVQQVDEILVMEDGRILEYGERIALAANPHSRFASLLRTGLEGVNV